MSKDRSPDQKKPCGCGGGEARPPETEKGAVTRRSMLKGAAVAVGASGASGLIGAAAAAGREERAPRAAVKPPYDIRDQVQDSHLDPAAIQAVYDDINRMALLIGGIPFGELFRSPLRRLVPRIKAQVPVAHSYGLISDPERVEHLGEAMAKKGPDVSIGDIYANARSEFSGKALKLFTGLRREGIRIPVPGDEKHQKQRANVIRSLIRDAPAFTFLDYYRVPSAEVSVGIQNAILFANKWALLGWGANDRCCTRNNNTFPNYYCAPAAGKFCAISEFGSQTVGGVLVGNCTLASEAC